MSECLPSPSGESAFERALAERVDDVVRHRVFVVDFPAHGKRRAEEQVSPEFDRLTGLLEAGGDHLAAARTAAVERTHASARQARALAAFARCRPAGELDRPDDEIGTAAAATRAARPAVLTAVSEWAVDEVMAALSVTANAAAALLSEAITLDEKLAATLAAAEAGTISWTHAQVLADLLGPVEDDETRAGLERRLLAYAPGHTPAQVRVAARRALLRVDARALAERAVRAVRDREVQVFSGDDGMATFTATMPDPLAAACYDALERLADATATPGDDRTRQQRMVDCLYDLILRPGNSALPPVQAQLTVVASGGTLTGGDEAGEINGRPVPAVVVREVAYALGLLPRPNSPAAKVTAIGADAVATAAARTEPREDEASESPSSALGSLLRTARLAGTALAERPQIAIVDELSGQLLALTNTPEVLALATCGRRACRSGREPCTHLDLDRVPGLGPPPGTDAYRPPEPLDRFVRARDRRCRFPGCRARPIRCDLDHTVPWPIGPTSSDNLCLRFPRFLGGPDAWPGGQAERGPPVPRSPLKYPLEVRQRAVEMVQTSGRPIASVAQELGLNPETLRKWVKAKQAAGKVPADELATPEEKDAEIRRLRAEVADLRRTNEILRAASAYFAQELGPARRSETSR